MIDEAKLHELVPAVVGKFAMWSKNSGIMDPFLYTVLWPRTHTPTAWTSSLTTR